MIKYFVLLKRLLEARLTCKSFISGVECMTSSVSRNLEQFSAAFMVSCLMTALHPLGFVGVVSGRLV